MNHRWVFGIFTLMAMGLGCQEQTSVSSISAETASVSTILTPQLKETAIEIIRKGLQDKNSHLRNACIEVVATTHQEELMPLVTRLMRDEMVPVRFSAALAIGDMPYPPGKAALESLRADPNPNVQLAAAYSLVKLGNFQHLNAVLQETKSQDQTVRSNAALLVGKLGNPANRPVLIALLQDFESSDKARLSAIESLAMLKDPTAYKNRLWPLLISKHPDDRIIGIRGMAELGTTEAKDAIVTMLQDDLVEVRLCAAEQLARIGDRSGQDVVLDYLNQTPGSEIDRDVADTFASLAIGRIGTPDLLAYLPKRIQSRSPMQQVYTAQAVLIASSRKASKPAGGSVR